MSRLFDVEDPEALNWGNEIDARVERFPKPGGSEFITYRFDSDWRWASGFSSSLDGPTIRYTYAHPVFFGNHELFAPPDAAWAYKPVPDDVQ